MSRSRMILLGGLVVLLAIAAVSASASALQYYVKGGALITGLLLIDGLGGTQVLKGKFAGAAFTTTCEHVDAHGTVTNTTSPASTAQSLLYLGCVVTGTPFAGCLVPEMMISMHVMGVLIGTAAVPGVEFLPPSGAILFNLAFEKCNTVELDKEFPIEGSFLGKINNATSSVSINEAAEGSMLSFGGNGMLLTGETKVEMTGGGLIEVR